MVFSVLQKTIQRPIAFQGTGLFSGQKSEVNLMPAPIDTGLVFKLAQTSFTAQADNVIGTVRTTVLGKGQKTIGTVEHFLAALYIFGISNLEIEVKGAEFPIFDGSAQEFVKILETAGIVEQSKLREALKIEEPIYVQEKEAQIIALPYDGLKISYLFHYPSSAWPSQFFSLILDQNQFIQEIASARTFSFYEEVKPLIEKGWLKGGSLQNAILIKDNQVLNEEGLRFKDELARHKILDLIGDLSLSGKVISGHIIALLSGHFLNVAFVKQLLEHERKKHDVVAFN